MAQKIPEEPATIISKYLIEQGNLPLIKSKEQEEQSTELWIQFAQAIAPYLSDNLRPDFLKETTEKWDPN